MTTPGEGASAEARAAGSDPAAGSEAADADTAGTGATGAAAESAAADTAAADTDSVGTDAAPTRRGRREERASTRPVPRRYSDTLRANIAGLVGVAGATAIFVPIILRESDRTESTPEGLDWFTEYVESIFIPYYMVFWVLFVLCYIAWTHLAYARTPRPELVRIAAEQSRRRPSLLAQMLGYGGAGSWTVAGAVVAAFLTVGLARTEMFRSEPLFILLGMATVAASWFAMVYSYALRYLRLHSGGERIDFDQLEPPVFGDYLTMAFMMSTMASTLGARIRTRTGWRAAREHTVLAFVFNTVIVAMTVSLLFGGLTQ